VSMQWVAANINIWQAKGFHVAGQAATKPNQDGKKGPKGSKKGEGNSPLRLGLGVTVRATGP
jgi:hypothetical protein